MSSSLCSLSLGSTELTEVCVQIFLSFAFICVDSRKTLFAGGVRIGWGHEASGVHRLSPVERIVAAASAGDVGSLGAELLGE